MNTSYVYNDTTKRIKRHGEKFPKKHGEWYRIKVLNKYWLLLDTWNGSISLRYGRCDPSDKDIYGGVVCFYSDKSELLAINFGRFYESPYLNYWRLHLSNA